jgi:hypothetical protein
MLVVWWVFLGLLILPFALVLRTHGMSSEPAQCFLFEQPGISEPALSKPGPGHLDANTNDAKRIGLPKTTGVTHNAQYRFAMP